MREIPRISESECEVMKLVWKHYPITSDEIISSLTDKMNWSTQTVKTFLNRLLKKGALRFEKVGRSYRYYPLVTEKEYIRAENKSYLERVYNGALDMLFSNFLEEEPLSEAEIEKLQKLLDKKKRSDSGQ